MSGQALYRRWRSQTFAEIIAQEHVTRTLQNALRGDRIAHAYLFTGPRGTGKTSTARVLAKAVNCLAAPEQRPCNECARCQAVTEGRDLDLIEIDAASNRGIDEIRALRDKVAFAPNEGRYKVYVVDEVHMLTTEAFNALLKTLEEPPPHVIFVLATTEPHRLPDTIVSRCQRFDFRRVPLADLAGKLERICQAEGIRIQPAAVEAIARRAGGSFRDAESLLDQLAAYGDEEITLERVQEVLGGVAVSAVADLVDAWIAADLGAGLRLINQLVDQGTDARQLHLELVGYLRSLLLLHAGGDEKAANVSPEMVGRMRSQLAQIGLARLVDGLRLFGQGDALARGEIRPQMPLELAFAQAVLHVSDAGGGRPAAGQKEAPVARQSGQAPARVASAARRADRPPAPVEQPVVTQPAAAERPETKDSPPPVEAPTAQEAAASSSAELTLSAVSARWGEVIQAMRPRDVKLQAFLRSGRPAEVRAGRVILEMEHSLSRDQVMQDKNRRLVEEVIREILGVTCQIECVVAEKGKRRASRPSALDNPAIREDRVLRYAAQELGAQVRGLGDKDNEVIK